MDVRVLSGREFWSGVLVEGGSTTIPEWTLDPVVGTSDHTQVIPADIVALLSDRAREVGAPLRAVLLAAHAKVLAALSGEREVTTGYLSKGRARPCRLSTEAGSWRGLLASCRQMDAALLEHREFPIE